MTSLPPQGCRERRQRYLEFLRICDEVQPLELRYRVKEAARQYAHAAATDVIKDFTDGTYSGTKSNS